MTTWPERRSATHWRVRCRDTPSWLAAPPSVVKRRCCIRVSLVPERSMLTIYLRPKINSKEYRHMAYSPIRPIPPKDFAVRALRPLDPGKSDDCLNSANKQLRASNEISAGQSRASCMASYRVENLPSWIRHHVGEAWSNYSEYIAQGGIDFCSETDDPADVCVRLANIPENLLDRLEPSFIGLEREADPDGFLGIGTRGCVKDTSNPWKPLNCSLAQTTKNAIGNPPWYCRNLSQNSLLFLIVCESSLAIKLA